MYFLTSGEGKQFAVETYRETALTSWARGFRGIYINK